jgi:excisionase family DNA binding protein
MRSRIRAVRRPSPRDQGPDDTSPPSPPKFLSVQGAAAFTGVSQQTIRRLIKARELKVYRLGKQIRIDQADLIDLMSRHQLKWL